MRKFYVDTSVWRDYFEDRRDNLRPLGEFAFRFFLKCKREKCTILVSKEVLRELLKFYTIERINAEFSQFEGLIIEVEVLPELAKQAAGLWLGFGSRFPLADVLHSVIARHYGAVLASRDKHFLEIGLADCVLPEEFS